MMYIIPILLQSVICGLLCAFCTGKIEKYYDVFDADNPPKQLERYLREPVELPSSEAYKLRDFGTRMEITKEYQEIVSFIEKRRLVEEAIREQSSLPVGYILSAIAVCFFYYFFRLNLALLLVFNAVSHIGFSKWAEWKLLKRLTARETEWTCKQYNGEYLAQEVYTTIYQAKMSVRHHYETVKSVYDGNKAAKQWYLFLAVIFSFVVVFTL